MARMSVSHLFAGCWLALLCAVSAGAQTATEFNNRGVAAEKAGNYDQAIAHYNNAIALNPAYAEAYYNRGAAFDDKGNYDQAISDYNKAIVLKPAYADAFSNRGFAYRHKGNWDQAIVDYSRAIQLNPGLANAYNNRGFAYSHIGNKELAITDFTTAIRINPDFASAYVFRGNEYYDRDDYTLAIADYDKAVRLSPNATNTYINRGNALRQIGRYDEAIADYTKAIQLEPTRAETYSNRGLTSGNKGEYARAIADYNKALELDPKATDTYYFRGWIYLMLNDGDSANRQAKTYLDLRGLQGTRPLNAIAVGYLGLMKAGKRPDAKSFMGSWINLANPGEWTTKILHFLNGDLTESQLLAAAVDNDKMTEAHLYIGEMQLLAGTPEPAKVHLTWVRDNGNKGFLARDLAIAELSRLGSPAIPKSTHQPGDEHHNKLKLGPSGNR